MSINRLSEISGVPYVKIYNTLATTEPKYLSLTLNEQNMISNALFKQMQAVFRDLGCTITIAKIK